MGFSELHSAKKEKKSLEAEKGKKGKKKIEGEGEKSVTVDVRRLERGGAFGFWGLVFKGKPEPSDVVCKMESIVLSIPTGGASLKCQIPILKMLCALATV